jgi:Spy/CpxP family protein refolding chaperone
MKKTTAIGLFFALTTLFSAPTALRAGQSNSPETTHEARSGQPHSSENYRATTIAADPLALRAGQSGSSETAGDKTPRILLTAAAPASKPAAPYAGQQTRAIKALSEKEIQGLLEGAGLGFAKAAELNHYPGPVHVIALASELGLTPARIARVKALYARMKNEARPLGEQIVAREKHLDTLFATRQIDQASLRAATGEIGRLRGSLRAVHLGYHLKMKTLLTLHQTATYDRLRGYGSGTMDHNKHGGQHR